ncbi:MAG: methyltransferase [Ruminococcaceae bacterium]|nr:methyltransferase [Oscillospiraceae bacterium]
MANEAKTYAIFRNMLRSKGYYDDSDIVVEEQKSDNAKIDKLLKNASKKGNKNGYPDFILYSKAYPELIIVVEAKADINKHESETRDNYADYAVDGALLYASFLSKEFDVLAIGISGEEEHRFKMSHYLHLKDDKKAYPLFDDVLLTVKEYFDGINQSNYKFNQDYAKLIAYTKTLNETLHAKKIKESQRALLISGILIALKDRAFKDGYKKHEKVAQLVKSLYTAIEGQLSSGDIPQKKIDVLTQAFGFVKTNPALTDAKTGKKFLEDLIDDIDREINGFMVTHQYVDTVSQFYIEFLRYANNDKGLGIVLTPPHITDLFAELAGVDKNSIVLDNCCGTGGFLISAMKRMLIDAKGDQAKEKDIKGKQLVGIEFQDDIYTLLISNMIIHRDGRTNIYWGDCFKEIDDVKKNFKPTVGLLNPPYKSKASDIEEFEFILNNLDALEPGGTCIAIIPISCVIEKTTIAENLRKRVLEKHTLEAVLSMPEELFHNSKVNTVTCAVIITAHKPHPKGKKTWFAYCRNDGFVKMKNKGRIDANHTWDDIREKWVSAFRNREVIDKFSLMREVSEKDEWCVEAYLETNYDEFTFEDYETTVKKYLMFNFMDMTGMTGGDEENEDL